jgi:hypothetical protein
MSEEENLDQKKLMLNLGCGDKKISGYINIDIRKECKPDLVCNVCKLPYEPNTVDRILASDILEHIGIHDLKGVLMHWHDILKKDGTLIIKTPNLDTIIDYYKTGKIPFEELVRKIYGQQDYEGNYHFTGFNPDSLYRELMYIGFVKIKIEPVLSGGDWSNMAVRCLK